MQSFTRGILSPFQKKKMDSMCFHTFSCPSERHKYEVPVHKFVWNVWTNNSNVVHWIELRLGKVS